MSRWQRRFRGDAPASDEPSKSAWTVLRCASKSEAARRREGGNKSIMRKPECEVLHVSRSGVVGFRRSWMGSSVEEQDYNKYREDGHRGRFEAGTNDRAVSITALSAYEALQGALPDAKVAMGDLGENLLIAGPALAGGEDLAVGTRLRVGAVELQITEANTPCFRFGVGGVSWTASAKAKVGELQPRCEKWWKSDAFSLGAHNPGGRGWLCKVLVEGEVRPGDLVTQVST